MKKLFALIFLSFFYFTLLIANPEKVLSSEKMREDILYLTNVMSSINPQLGIRKELMGQDVVKDIQDFALPLIDSNLNAIDFGVIVHKCLNLAADQHCRLYDNFYSFQLKKIYPKIRFNDYVRQLKRLQKIQYELPFSIPYLYSDANECFFFSTIVADSAIYSNGKRQSIKDTIQAGSKLIKIDDIALEDYCLLENRYWDRALRWDNDERRYYTNQYYRIFSTWTTIYGSDTLAMGGRGLSLNGEMNWDYGVSKAFFLKDDIIYVRLAEMNLNHKDQIISMLNSMRNEKIKAVIIDVRNNEGGNDQTWIDLLSFLTNKPISFNEEILLCKDSEMSRKIWKRIVGKKNLQEAIDSTSVTIFGESFFNIEYGLEPLKITPSKNSFGYEGRYYILSNENTYSSAGALTSLAYNNPQLFTVIGTPSGWFQGRGTSPFLFKLPNSKYIIQMSPILDYTNVELPIDAMQDRVHIEIQPTIEECIISHQYSGERYGKDFLLTSDSYVKKTLELIKKEEI